MSRLRVWAGYLDPDFSHSQRVAQLALLLYDGLKDAGLVAGGAGAKPSGAKSGLRLRERCCRRRRSCMMSAKRRARKSIKRNRIG